MYRFLLHTVKCQNSSVKCQNSSVKCQNSSISSNPVYHKYSV